MIQDLQKILNDDLRATTQQGVVRFEMPRAGTITKVRLSVGGHTFGTSYFNIRLAGVALWSGEDRLKLVGSTTVAVKDALSIACSQYDVLRLDLEQRSQALVSGPVTLIVTFDDGVEFQEPLTPEEVADEAARYALTDKVRGDIVKQTDTGVTYIVIDPEQLDGPAGWMQISGAGGGSGADLQVFTSDGTWNNPSPMVARPAKAILIGAGGGGGAGCFVTSGQAAGGSGGGGGAFAEFDFQTTDFGSTVAVQVGVGGTGGIGPSSAGSGPDGQAGENTVFGSNAFVAGGGGGGGGGVAATTKQGGGGGGMAIGTDSGAVGQNGGTASVINGGGPGTGGSVNNTGLGGGSSTTSGSTNGTQGGGSGGRGINQNGGSQANAGRSVYGAGGGGGGGGLTLTGLTSFAGGEGGLAGAWLAYVNTNGQGGGGAAGADGATSTSGGVGASGANSLGIRGGNGGGGGGATRSATNGHSGGDGGNGGFPGGGGGGGGAKGHATSTGKSGDGGDGANGLAIVIVY